MKSEFGNPVWQDDEIPADDHIWAGRLEGISEALRLISGPSIMTNSTQFQQGVDAAIELLIRRQKEIQNLS